jgi:hypothetical protein
MPNWLSVEEAVGVSGYNPGHIRRLIRDGQIRAEKKGLMWWIDRRSLLDYLNKAKEAEDRRRGPRPKPE